MTPNHHFVTVKTTPERGRWGVDEKILDGPLGRSQALVPGGGRLTGPTIKSGEDMRSIVRRLAVVSLIGLPVLGGIIVPASPSGAATSIHAVAASASPKAHVPNVNITGKGATAKYSKTALTVKETATVTDCENGFVSFTMTNKGAKTQYVTFEGSAFVALPPATQINDCIYGGSKGDSGVFGLSNKKNTKAYASTLTITTSD